MKRAPNGMHDRDAEAIEALERARNLPPGNERSEAMKTAGRLRAETEASRRLRPGHYPPQRVRREDN